MMKEFPNPTNQVGPFRPVSAIRQMRYVGENRFLRGCTALVGLGQHGTSVVAQFDDTSTGFGFGWWVFAPSDFEKVEEPHEVA